MMDMKNQNCRLSPQKKKSHRIIFAGKALHYFATDYADYIKTIGVISEISC